MKTLFTYVYVLALDEARDITLYLKPLRRLLEDMEQYDFSELHKILPAILHIVGLLWANSRFYCSPPRIIVLLQELCNMIIDMVRSHGRGITCIYQL
jgi:dynein heavy chain